MIRSFSFRSLVLTTIAVVLTAATAGLAALAYTSIYQVILAGFDGKLRVLSDATAVFTDGEGHREFQRPRRLTTLVAEAANTALGFDAERGELVRVDIETGSAAALDSSLLRSRPIHIRSTAFDPGRGEGQGRLYLLSTQGELFQATNLASDRVTIEPVGVAIQSGPIQPGPIQPGPIQPGPIQSDAIQSNTIQSNTLQADAKPSEDPQGAGSIISDPIVLDQIVYADRLYARAAQNLWALGGTAGESAADKLRLDEPVISIAHDPATDQWIGIDVQRTGLLRFERNGTLLSRQVLDLAEREVNGLLVLGGTVYIASDALLRFDPETASLVEDFAPGYYSEEDAYFARHAPIYQRLRERSGLTFLYTEVFLGGDQIRYILDGSVGDDHSPPGSPDSVPAEDIDAIARAQAQGVPFVSGIREWEEWGLVKVSAAPIHGNDGSIVALAGADVDIGVIRSKTRNALFAVLGVGAVLLILAGSVSVWIAQAITRPLREIKNAALRIAAGQFGTRLVANSRDEVGQLGRNLDALSLRLEAQAREAKGYETSLVDGRLRNALDAVLRKRGPTGSMGEYQLGSRCLAWQIRSDMASLMAHARASIIAERILHGLSASDQTLKRFMRAVPGATAVALADELDSLAPRHGMDRWWFQDALERTEPLEPNVRLLKREQLS